jgi:hypothetical protein
LSELSYNGNIGLKLIVTGRTAILMATQESQVDIFEQSISTIGITKECRLLKPLDKPIQLQTPLTGRVNSIEERKNSFLK